MLVQKIKKVLSICMTIILGIASFVICSSAETIYDKYGFFYPATDNTYASICVKLDDLKYEFVNGSQFVYVVFQYHLF